MFVNAIQIFEYESAAGPWIGVMVRKPDWHSIEMAIRRLDRCLFPFVWLYLNPDGDADDVPDLEIIGGYGESGISANRTGQRPLTRFSATLLTMVGRVEREQLVAVIIRR